MQACHWLVPPAHWALGVSLHGSPHLQCHAKTARSQPSVLSSLPCLSLNTCRPQWVTNTHGDGRGNFNIKGLKRPSLSQNLFHLSIWHFSQFQKPCKHSLGFIKHLNKKYIPLQTPKLVSNALSWYPYWNQSYPSPHFFSHPYTNTFTLL